MVVDEIQRPDCVYLRMLGYTFLGSMIYQFLEPQQRLTRGNKTYGQESNSGKKYVVREADLNEHLLLILFTLVCYSDMLYLSTKFEQPSLNRRYHLLQSPSKHPITIFLSAFLLTR
jgi:hypothetical protein